MEANDCYPLRQQQIQRKVSISSRTINKRASPMYGDVGLFPIRQCSLPVRDEPPSWTPLESGPHSLGVVNNVEIEILCSCSPSRACTCQVPFPSPASRSKSPMKMGTTILTSAINEGSAQKPGDSDDNRVHSTFNSTQKAEAFIF